MVKEQRSLELSIHIREKTLIVMFGKIISNLFINKDFSAQRMKTSFICNLWSWSNVYIVERPRSLVDFFTWLGCSYGLVGIVFCGLVGFRFAYLFSFFAPLWVSLV